MTSKEKLKVAIDNATKRRDCWNFEATVTSRDKGDDGDYFIDCYLIVPNHGHINFTLLFNKTGKSLRFLDSVFETASFGNFREIRDITLENIIEPLGWMDFAKNVVSFGV